MKAFPCKTRSVVEYLGLDPNGLPKYKTIEPSIEEAGMDLRDYFAAKAMQAILIATYEGGNSKALLGSTAYKFADEMIEAREQ